MPETAETPVAPEDITADLPVAAPAADLEADDLTAALTDEPETADPPAATSLASDPDDDQLEA